MDGQMSTHCLVTWCLTSLSGRCLEMSWSQRMLPTTDLPRQLVISHGTRLAAEAGCKMSHGTSSFSKCLAGVDCTLQLALGFSRSDCFGQVLCLWLPIFNGEQVVQFGLGSGPASDRAGLEGILLQEKSHFSLQPFHFIRISCKITGRQDPRSQS